MEKRTLLFTVFLLLVASFIGCNREEQPPVIVLQEEEMIPEPMVIPNVITLETCEKVVLRYFPYLATDTILFQNNQSEEIWQIVPQISSENSMDFPTITSYNNGELGTPWYLKVESSFVTKGTANEERKDLFASCQIFPRTADGKVMELIWEDMIFPTENKEDRYFGRINYQCDSSELFSCFTDTITIPLKNNGNTLLQNAFVHLVRGWGITEFSLDGISVWKMKKS